MKQRTLIELPELKPGESSVPHFRKRAAGRCYEVAGRKILEQDCWLCHGSRGLIDDASGHAWIEFICGGPWFVVDPSHPNVRMGRDRYYSMLRIEAAEVKRYSPRLAARLFASTGHWGPWNSGELEMRNESTSPELLAERVGFHLVSFWGWTPADAADAMELRRPAAPPKRRQNR